MRVLDVRLQTPPHVRLFRQRTQGTCLPIVAANRRNSSCDAGRKGDSPLPEDPLFRNHRGSRLTRFGVRYILRKRCARAQAARPALASKRLHPHSLRHSTAVHLLRAGVDILTISQWLGHASVTTTNRYATTDLEMKRKAIEQAQAIDHTTDDGAALWRTDASILAWLEAL